MRDLLREQNQPFAAAALIGVKPDRDGPVFRRLQRKAPGHVGPAQKLGCCEAQARRLSAALMTPSLLRSLTSNHCDMPRLYSDFETLPFPS